MSLYIHISEMLHTLRRNDKGISAVEYGLLAALIAVVIIVAVRFIGTSLSTTFSNVGTQLTGS
jgi:pilus assembly protein Flp/PilA